MWLKSFVGDRNLSKDQQRNCHTRSREYQGEREKEREREVMRSGRWGKFHQVGQLEVTEMYISQ